MFISNKHNEVVNLDHVKYVRVYGDRAPYEMHVFVDDNRLVLQYDSEEELKAARATLMKELRKAYPRWIEISQPEYYIRADKVKGVISWHNGVKVMFDEGDMTLYTSDGPAECLRQVVESLREVLYDSSAVIEL